MHKRLLKLDTNALTYYKLIPKEFEDMKTKHKDLAEMNLITKATLPLEAIFSVSKLTDEDREARKKFLSGDPKVNGWKIEFDKSLLFAS